MTEKNKKEENTIRLPGEQPVHLNTDLSNEYFPMDDYAANDYRPFNGRKCHFCRACIDYYDKLHQAGMTRFPFMPKCAGDVSTFTSDIPEEEFGEDYDYLKILQDPVAWAKFEFDWDARWYQIEMMRCSSQFKAMRAGRRVGKSESMAILCLWHLFTNGGLEDDQFEILVVAPYQPQVAKIFDIIRGFIKRSNTLCMPGVIKRDVLNPQLIEFSSGGIIRGWSSGSHSGAKSDKIRGQDANLIVIDEVDYVNDADIEVIMAILASDPECKLMVASTPKGIRQKLHQWSTDKNQRFKEFWYISAESPSWTPDAERIFKTNYSENGYAKEFLAEFGEEAEGVFRTSDINSSLLSYDLKDCRRHDESKYVIGVDWNKTTGTHIVVVEAMKIAGIFKYRLVDKHIIRKAEFQQLTAIEKIIELDNQWTNQQGYIYVDAGYGHVQVEIMWRKDVDFPEENTRYRDRVIPVTMNQQMEIRDPVSGEIRKKQIKQFMVDTTARAFEQRQIILPKSEDTVTRIIPDEIQYADIGLVQQARNFTVLKYSPTGVPSYSQDYEHTLTAFMLAIMGHFLQYSDVSKVDNILDVSFSNGIGSSYGKPKNPIPGFEHVAEKTMDEAIEESKRMADNLRPISRGIEDDKLQLMEHDAGSLIAGLQSSRRINRRSNSREDDKKKRFGRRPPRRGRTNI